MTKKRCAACGKSFLPKPANRKFCSTECWRPIPAIYRYVCPDGRSYVGSTRDYRDRDRYGIDHVNSWLAEAYAKYLPELWRFEVLEQEPRDDVWLRQAEQCHIERLRSSEHGFNMRSAVWSVDTPAIVTDARFDPMDEADILVVRALAKRRNEQP